MDNVPETKHRPTKTEALEYTLAARASETEKMLNYNY
jgi:hypothetical protein